MAVYSAASFFRNSRKYGQRRTRNAPPWTKVKLSRRARCRPLKQHPRMPTPFNECTSCAVSSVQREIGRWQEHDVCPPVATSTMECHVFPIKKFSKCPPRNTTWLFLRTYSMNCFDDCKIMHFSLQGTNYCATESPSWLFFAATTPT